MVMNKTDYATTLATLLSLDHIMTSDLMLLQESTLAKMYVNYIQSAKESNHAIERVESKYAALLSKDEQTHLNRSIPPVGMKILVLVADEWVLGTRESWVNNKDKTFTLKTKDNGDVKIKRENIAWRYP